MQRQQMRVLALGAFVVPVGLVVDLFAGSLLVWVGLGLAVPLAATAAVLTYRLYDLDLVCNRSLVYGALTLVVVGGYVGIVAVVASVLGGRYEQLPPLVATAVVALAFHPVHQRVQRAVNRLLYGDRHDPYTVLSRLNRRLEQVADPVTTLPQITEAVTDALQLPFAAIELADGGRRRPVASFGRPLIEPEAFPMTYQRRVVGDLLVSPRSPTTSFTGTERRLLHEVATQAGLAAHAVQLTTDLQVGRERLVRSREEERRRLRRELHDGVGPALAGMTLQVGAARALVTQGSDLVDDTLGELERQLQGCLSEVRRVTEDLRPSALDRLGLAEAIRARARAYSPPGSSVRIIVSAQGDGDLPAAVEVAAYRIAIEALTNVVHMLIRAGVRSNSSATALW